VKQNDTSFPQGFIDFYCSILALIVFFKFSGFKDAVLNKVTAFSYYTGMDISLRYAQKKANLQAAAQDHDYLSKNFLES
jgi:hypothetical protein